MTGFVQMGHIWCTNNKNYPNKCIINQYIKYTNISKLCISKLWLHETGKKDYKLVIQVTSLSK